MSNGRSNPSVWDAYERGESPGRSVTFEDNEHLGESPRAEGAGEGLLNVRRRRYVANSDQKKREKTRIVSAQIYRSRTLRNVHVHTDPPYQTASLPLAMSAASTPSAPLRAPFNAPPAFRKSFPSGPRSSSPPTKRPSGPTMEYMVAAGKRREQATVPPHPRYHSCASTSRRLRRLPRKTATTYLAEAVRVPAARGNRSSGTITTGTIWAWAVILARARFATGNKRHWTASCVGHLVSVVAEARPARSLRSHHSWRPRILWAAMARFATMGRSRAKTMMGMATRVPCLRLRNCGVSNR